MNFKDVEIGYSAWKFSAVHACVLFGLSYRACNVFVMRIQKQSRQHMLPLFKILTMPQQESLFMSHLLHLAAPLSSLCHKHKSLMMEAK